MPPKGDDAAIVLTQRSKGAEQLFGESVRYVFFKLIVENGRLIETKIYNKTNYFIFKNVKYFFFLDKFVRGELEQLNVYVQNKKKYETYSPWSQRNNLAFVNREGLLR